MTARLPHWRIPTPTSRPDGELFVRLSFTFVSIFSLFLKLNYSAYIRSTAELKSSPAVAVTSPLSTACNTVIWTEKNTLFLKFLVFLLVSYLTLCSPSLRCHNKSQECASSALPPFRPSALPCSFVSTYESDFPLTNTSSFFFRHIPFSELTLESGKRIVRQWVKMECHGKFETRFITGRKFF
jgi:hypothetical protein